MPNLRNEFTSLGAYPSLWKGELFQTTGNKKENGNQERTRHSLLKACPVSVATLDFSSASVPVDYWTAGTVVSLAVTPGVVRPKLGMSETELTPRLPLLPPVAPSLDFLISVRVIVVLQPHKLKISESTLLLLLPSQI
ncbi:Gamma-Interferon-Inducible Protein 16 [Manis pentadactyla]|nr:Gamma-Interferon-Inducible Protein 16 [Manis pentadactyla]